MDKTEEASIARQKFLTLIRQVRTEHFEKDSMDEGSILEDAIARDAKLWNSVQPFFAREAALTLVRRIVKGTPLMVDQPQQKLFEDLPERIAIPKRKWKPLNKATLDELRWHTDWYEKRLLGNHNRTERDQSILDRLKHLVNVVSRYADKDGSITVEEALEERERRGVH
jgi:hypothetical protein